MPLVSFNSIFYFYDSLLSNLLNNKSTAPIVPTGTLKGCQLISFTPTIFLKRSDENGKNGSNKIPYRKNQHLFFVIH
ncbi:MAG: hypothetical protein H9893_09750 [Candidatus Niameybacter stercoravium]|nr:hypothetical protein [Candidatus Niameybacter stercoravium]